MGTDNSAILLCCTALGALFVLGLIWANLRARSMFQEWGKANGFEVLSHEECLRFSRESLGRSTYRLTVRDTAGRRRAGYAHCGLLGLLTNDIVVRWDD